MVETVDELIEWTREQLRIDRPWVIVRSQKKLTKTLFEVEDDGRRYIGKVSPTQNEVGTFDLMKRVWDAGMRPPSPYQIAEPVAWLPERSLLIISKAPGHPLMQLVRERNGRAMEGMEQAGAWLHAMQSLRVELPAGSNLTAILERCDRELKNPRVTPVVEMIRDEIESTNGGVAAHGDFHPVNVYTSPQGPLVAIDLDTLSRREPAFDVANFFSQLAIMGHHAFGNFEETAELRNRFLTCAPPVPEDRLRLHVAFALIRSLHYDLCILKVRKRDHVESFLRAAEHGLDT
jgi:hypothetical protein